MAMPKNVTGYRFIDKDPVLDVFRDAKRRAGMTNGEIAESSGITTNTLRRWDLGKTRRPQHVTLRYAMAALGFEEQWVSIEGNLRANYVVGASNVVRFRRAKA